MTEYLKIPEVARRLDVSEKTVRRYIKSGELPSVFIGGAYRVSEEDLETFLDSARVTPGSGYPKGPASPSLEPSLNDVIEERRLSRFAGAVVAAADKCVETMTAPDTDPKIVAGMVDTLVVLHEAVVAPLGDEQRRQALTTEEGDEILAVSKQLLEAASTGVQRLEEAATDAEQEEHARRMQEAIREWTRKISA